MECYTSSQPRLAARVCKVAAVEKAHPSSTDTASNPSTKVKQAKEFPEHLEARESSSVESHNRTGERKLLSLLTATPEHCNP